MSIETIYRCDICQEIKDKNEFIPSAYNIEDNRIYDYYTITKGTYTINCVLNSSKSEIEHLCEPCFIKLLNEWIQEKFVNKLRTGEV